jgi:PhzF family phenazine biosynthesis protein
MSIEVLRYSAFTYDGAGGNPAGVVLDAGTLTDPQMVAVAQAIGYSETAFLTSLSSTGREPDGSGRAEASVRFFSPAAEVPFCGHATIATAIAVAERTGPGVLRLQTRAGEVVVETRLEHGGLVATLTSPPTSTRRVGSAVLDETLVALRWTRADLDPRYPVHVAFAGNDHLVLAVRSRETLAALDYDYPALARVMAREGWTTAHLFWSENATTFHARDPFPPGGVVEDPATGAAAAAFGGYLRDLRLAPVPGRVVVHQGHDMGAPSELLVDLDPQTPTVRVAGRATTLALSPYDEVAW